jgi:muramoyltetrapeptide carboxypeptidase
LIGFSDITILHAAISKIGIESIHGQMPVNFNNQSPKKELNKLFDLLKQNTIKHTFGFVAENKPGVATAEFFGGNLSIICSLIGTPFLPYLNGKILFIEEVGEYLYRIDRMVHQLKLAGIFNGLAGLVVGYFNKLDDNQPPFGLTFKEIILDAIQGTDYPVAFDFPLGMIIRIIL